MTRRGLGRAILRQRAALAIAILVVSAGAASALYFMTPRGTQTSGNPGPPTGMVCKGTASCFSDTVRYIVDGDTLDVGTVRIRLTLVNTPEVSQSGYAEATQFTAQTCPIGSSALVDEDDGQTGGSHGRIVALVNCGDVNLNAALLSSGNAVLVTYYCSVSEFADEPWTGCP